jgi:hypothetical protein
MPSDIPQTTPLQCKLADVARLGDACRETNNNPSITDAYNTKFAEMIAEARKSFGLEER